MKPIYPLVFLIVIMSVFPLTQASTEEITFIAMGHIYPDYDALNISLDLIEQENPDFVVFLGDSLPAPNESWDELKPLIDKISAPVYFAPGNHDIYRNEASEGVFASEISPELFFTFKIRETNFIILNTVSDKESDISEEQVEFIESVLDPEKNNVFFMHHCLFYNYNNQFCNSRPFIKENNWNKLVPSIQNKTLAVFVGDVGINEPYFGYKENGISYFGVGFSPKESQLKIPQHMLKVTLNEEGMKVTPIPIRQDLTKTKYVQRVDKQFFPLFKSFIKKNLALVLRMVAITIALLIVIIIFLSYKLLRNHKARRSTP